MIYTEISQDDFIYNFKSMSENYKDKFSIDGLRALYDYLNDYSEETGEDIKLDEVAICCEYTEYKTAYEAMENYQPEDMPTLEDSEGMDLVEIQEATEEKALEWLQDRTQVILLKDNNGVIIADF